MGEARPWRFPIAVGDEELHGLEPLLPLRIVAIAYADAAAPYCARGCFVPF
jgi:hypothetical protein